MNPSGPSFNECCQTDGLGETASGFSAVLTASFLPVRVETWASALPGLKPLMSSFAVTGFSLTLTTRSTSARRASSVSAVG